MSNCAVVLPQFFERLKVVLSIIGEYHAVMGTYSAYGVVRGKFDL